MAPISIDDPRFDRPVALRDAYRIMQGFVQGYLARGDATVSDFLHAYAAQVPGGRTTDPAALDDFLAAAGQVLQTTKPED